MQQQLCDEITDMVLHYFDVQEEELTRDLGSNHHHIMQYVYQRALESDGHLTVLELCRELQMPHRSLHYAFEKTTGMSPNKYIRAIRLNAADRIIHKHKDMPKLTDLAHQYGFSHSSHFGREYKKLFRRIPSNVKLNA
ncbi:helix-turn-helix domain-containing protein (plasmid) [Acinetobacter sp. ANC 7454]|nr:helix-turn-helix domain-containing protein [Acinetobacter sp. HR7]